MALLRIVPIFQDEAFAFVEAHHRHHDPSPGSIFQLAVANDAGVVGVVIVGRPVARLSQNGWCAEVIRLCVAPWDREERPRVDTHPLQVKLRWEVCG